MDRARAVVGRDAHVLELLQGWRTLRQKLTRAAQAAALVGSSDTVATSSFVGIGTPDELLLAVSERFVTAGEPPDLTLLFAAGQGDGT